jgi:HK97 family phage major capsid protein
MSATDAMLSRFQAELEERRTFMDGLIEAAESAGRDLTTEEMDLYTRAKDRMRVVEGQMEPLREGARIAVESRRKTQELIGAYATARNPEHANVEYRTAGAYVAELYFAQLGDDDARHRLDVFHRVAAHQTTADNPGLIPERVVQPVLNYIEVARPIVASVGPVDPGTGSWAYATVTQHTQVGKQAGEKTELPSRKMLITKTPLGADTFGGYVNVSKQDINRTSPAILDMVIADLAQQYAIETEEEAGTVLTTAATAGPTIPTAPDADAIYRAVYGAAGQVFAATKGQGRTIVAVSPDMLGYVGPILGAVPPANANVASGFSAGAMGQGQQGQVSAIAVIMSAGLTTGTIIAYSTAAVKAFEHSYGNLQVVEPSVWGVQVGYAGDFDFVVVEPAGVVKMTVTP